MNGQRLGLIFIASAALLLLYAGLRGLDLTGWLAARQGAAPQRAHRAVETANELRDPKGFALTLPTGWRVERRGRDHIRVECERAAFAGRGEGEPEGFVRTGGEAPRVDLLRADGGGAQIRWRPAPDSDAAFDALAATLIDTYVEDMRGHWGAALEEVTRVVEPGARHHARYRTQRGDEAWLLEETVLRLGPHLLIFQGGCPAAEAAPCGAELLALVASARD